MGTFKPRRLIGKWRDGWALDLHTLRSEFVGYDEYGRPRFETTRSEIGELLYDLKFRQNKEAAGAIADAAHEFLRRWKPDVDLLVPVPSSTPRPWQPVEVLVDEIGKRTGHKIQNCVTRTREAPQLKNVFDLDERLGILQDLHRIAAGSIDGRSVLLVDDLYRSGATLNSITEALYSEGGAKSVHVLAMTKTRSNR